MSADPKACPTPASNLVLRQLQGLRWDTEAVREREDRTQHLIPSFDQHREAGFRQMEARFQQTEVRFADLRRAATELGSDATLQENRLLTRHNEILEILRRLDASEMPGEPTEEE